MFPLWLWLSLLLLTHSHSQDKSEIPIYLETVMDICSAYAAYGSVKGIESCREAAERKFAIKCLWQVTHPLSPPCDVLSLLTITDTQICNSPCCYPVLSSYYCRQLADLAR